MPPRAKSKTQNQPKKEEMSPIVQQMKSAMTPSIPIEQVVYLNDDKVVIHEKGSNRYWINYPDTWRTIANQQLVLGVRAIRKYGCSDFTMAFSIVYSVEEVSKYWRFDFRETFLARDLEPGKEEEFVARINRRWRDWGEELSDEGKTCLADYLSHEWTFLVRNETLQESRRWLRSPIVKQDEFTLSYTITTECYNTSTDFRQFFEGPYYSSTYNPKSGGYCVVPIFLIRDNAFKTYIDTYLIAASFVGQTNYQYLGFTNTEFVPPKQYVVSSGDTKFWIDVVMADGRGEVELDSRNLVAIELQLTTIPLQKYV